MDFITVEHNPSPMKLEVLNVDIWPIWTHEVGQFDWHYDTKEMCYILEGEVVVTPVNGEPVTLKERDLVNFPKGMDCSWDIRSPISKHYLLET